MSTADEQGHNPLQRNDLRLADADKEAETVKTAIRNARIFDGTGADISEPATVVIEGDRIESVLPHAEASVDERTTVIDAGGKTLLPGLIDSHIHIIGNPKPDRLKQMKELVPHAAIRATVNARETLHAGFTAARDAGSNHHLAVALRLAIDEGLVPGPRLHVAGKGLSITGGHGDFQNGWPPELQYSGRYVVDGPDEARRAAREQLRDGADHIKLHATGGVMSEGDIPTARGLTLEEMRAAIDEAVNVGKKTMAHAQGSLGIKNAILAGISSIEHGFYLTDEIIELMLERDVFLVPTLAAVHHIVTRGTEAGIPEYGVRKAREAQQAHLQSFARANRAGVRIAMGTDAATPYNYHGCNALELELMVKAGMSPTEALVSATTGGAELMGLADSLGQIRSGFWADLVIVDGDPTSDISVLGNRLNIAMVMKAGEMVINTLAG